MIKNDRWIRRWAEEGGVAPYAPDQVNAASYDVRVSEHWICPTREPEEFTYDHVSFPGEVGSPPPLEYVRSRRDVACDRESHATLAACDQPLARRWCDPGFEGRSRSSCRTSVVPSSSTPAASRPAILIAMEKRPRSPTAARLAATTGQRGTTTAR